MKNTRINPVTQMKEVPEITWWHMAKVPKIAYGAIRIIKQIPQEDSEYRIENQ